MNGKDFEVCKMDQQPQESPQSSDTNASSSIEDLQSNYLSLLYPLGQPSQNLRRILQVAGIVLFVAILLSSGIIKYRSDHPLTLNISSMLDVGMVPGSTYLARVPGPGCDTHGGRWQAIPYTQATCTGDKLRVTAHGLAVVNFLGPSLIGTIASEYDVGVDVSPLNTLNTGLVIHESSYGLGNAIYVCSDGNWGVFNNDLGDINYGLPGGNVTPGSTYHLVVMVRGQSIIIQINGHQVGRFTDTEFTSNGIGLIAFGDEIVVDFQNFTYTPFNLP